MIEKSGHQSLPFLQVRYRTPEEQRDQTGLSRDHTVRGDVYLEVGLCRRSR